MYGHYVVEEARTEQEEAQDIRDWQRRQARRDHANAVLISLAPNLFAALNDLVEASKQPTRRGGNEMRRALAAARELRDRVRNAT